MVKMQQGIAVFLHRVFPKKPVEAALEWNGKSGSEVLCATIVYEVLVAARCITASVKTAFYKAAVFFAADYA